MLSIKQIENAKPREKPYKLFDKEGLYLWITPTAKCFRYKYRIAGKEKTLSLGEFPALPLAEARERHAAARKLVSKGICPSTQKRQARQSAAAGADNKFRAICESWYAEIAPHRSPTWQAQMRRYIDRDLLPAFGSRPVEDVTPADVLALTKRLAQECPNTGRFVQQLCSRIFAYAVRNLKTKYNPARELAGTIVVPTAVHHTALEPAALPEFLALVDGYAGRPATALAIRALLLTAVRKGELLNAKWAELDLDAGKWLIPAERMKGRREHWVPLSDAAIAVFKQLKPLGFGSEWVLPNMCDPRRPMHPSTLNAVFVRRSIKAAPHGMRAAFSTWANENGHRSDVIEACLAHHEKNAVRAAYNRAQYWPERRALMQAWGDHVAGIAQPKTNVTSIEDHRRRA